MKKIAAATACISLLMTGCSFLPAPSKGGQSPMPHHPDYDANAPYHKGKKGEHKKGAKKERHPDVYGCEKNTVIAAKYHPQHQIASLNITAPTLGLKAQEVDLKQVSSGSGERYINDKNKASIYEWHVKGKDGLFSVTADNKAYTYRCQLQYPHEKR